MAIPKFHELFKVVLKALADGESYSLKELLDIVALKKKVSSDERAVLLKNGPRTVFNAHLSWARTYLKAAGLVIYPSRGYTQLSDEGKNVIDSNPKVIDLNFLLRYKSFRKFIADSLTSSYSSSEEKETHQGAEAVGKETPAELMDKAYSEINSSLSHDLLSEIMSRPQKFFEMFVVKLLIMMGYEYAQEQAPGEMMKFIYEGGIHSFIHPDRLAFRNLYFQAKRWNPDKTVGLSELQSFYDAIKNKQGRGVYVTTANYSKQALQFAKEKKLELIDGKDLTSLMIECGVGVYIEKSYDIKRIDSDYFLKLDQH
jgi:restriction system protein